MTMTMMAAYLALLVLTTCNVLVAAASSYAPPPYPTARFTPWDGLEVPVRDAAHALGYHGKSWNQPGKLTAVESLDWDSLTPAQQKLAATMQLTDLQWDCYINHYRHYKWSELEPEAHEIAGAYSALGWTEVNWKSLSTPQTNRDDDQAVPTLVLPPSEGKMWEDLTPEEQAAAQTVCYTKELWNEVEIPLWPSTVDPSTATITSTSIAEVPTKEEEKKEEQDESPEEEEVKQDLYENLYETNDRSKTAFQGPLSAHNSRQIPVPYFRYVPWDLLPTETHAIAAKARYDEKTWNAIGSHWLETTDFETVGKDHPRAQAALQQLGFTQDTWDCYIAHYKSYSWDDLKKANVQAYYQELGYSHKAWEAQQKPETDGMYWPDLTPTQQNAAYELGYFREVWDDVSLQFWPRTTSNTESLKKYVLGHKAVAVGSGVAVTLTLLVGLIFACACCCRCCCGGRRQRKQIPHNDDNDLEMSCNEFEKGGYTDQPIEGREHDETYDDEYDEEE